MQTSFEPYELALFRRVIDNVRAELRGCNVEIEAYIAYRVICRAQLGNWDYNALLSAARDTSPFAQRNETMRRTFQKPEKQRLHA